MLALSACLCFFSSDLAAKTRNYDQGSLLRCRQVTTSTDGLVTIEVNIAPRNHREAALSIALALFVIIELMVFISVLNNTAMDLLVKPVAHILHVIRTQAQKVMAALDTDEVCLLASRLILSLYNCTSFFYRDADLLQLPSGFLPFQS